MAVRFFLVAAVVLFVFGLIASVVHGGVFITAHWYTWCVSGLISWALDQLLVVYNTAHPRQVPG
jgi:hypothetical protein